MSESIIAEDLKIKGELSSSGDIELKGQLDGEVTCRTLTIEGGSEIVGKATAEKVIVRGSVDGTISGIRVVLTPSAKVKGDVICEQFSVDEEAYFDGTSHRVSDPLGKKDSKKKLTDAQSAKFGNGTEKSNKDGDAKPLNLVKKSESRTERLV